MCKYMNINIQKKIIVLAVLRKYVILLFPIVEVFIVTLTMLHDVGMPSYSRCLDILLHGTCSDQVTNAQ